MNTRNLDVQRIRFNRMVFFIAVTSIFVMAFKFILDNDTWWHLAAGERILQTGKILRQDPFSLTMSGTAWEYPGWLAQVLLAFIYRIGGLVGLNSFGALLVCLTFVALWFVLDGPSLLRLSVLLLSAIVSSVFWSVRPQLFSFLFSSLFVLILEKENKKPTPFIWSLPFLMAVWGNMHGGFVIGFMILGGYFISRLLQQLQTIPAERSAWRNHFRPLFRLAGVGLAAVLGLVFNPDGLGLLLYPFKTVGMEVLQNYIMEWQSPDFHLLEMQPFLWMLILACASMVFSTHRLRLADIPSLFLFSYAGFLAARNISTFALIAAPILSRHVNSIFNLHPSVKKLSKPINPVLSRIFNIVLIISVVILGVVIRKDYFSESMIRKEMTEQIPVSAIEYLAENEEQGNLFHSYNWGGYIIWRLYPEYSSFVDGRTDLFGDEVLSTYLQIWSADRRALDLLDSYNISVVLVEPDAPLVSLLDCSDWKLIYEDMDAVLYSR